MDHKTLQAKAVATDQGEFTAIAAAYTVDRMNERILPGAFKSSINRWRDSGKQIPLHWDHMTEAENIIGTVDPASMREVKDGLEVKGQLDLEENATAREAWRLMKRNAVALSFGYLVLSDAKAKDGVRELKDLDLFEITITPAPANPDTRFIDLKSVKQMSPGAMAERLRAMAEDAPEEMAGQMRAMADRLDAMEKSFADRDSVSLSPEAVISGTELKGAQEGDLKAVWTAAYIADLPDSAFLHIDETRHFPYRDAQGNSDLSHLQNALKCIPQSDLSPDVKEKLTAKAQQILDNAKAIEDRSEEPARAKLPQDPLVAQYDEAVFEITTRGLDTRQPVEAKKVDPEPQPSLAELEAQLDGIELDILTRGEAI